MDKKYVALTQSQISLWTGQKLNPESPLYNMAHSFDIRGVLNLEGFTVAFNELLKRADALRTIFTEVDGIPSQSVLPSVEYQLEIIDFTSKEEIAIHNWMKKRSQINFDLTQPLFDSVLIKVNTERHIWFLNIHHLVTDATSSTILYKLQAELYTNILGGTLTNVGETPSYANYLLFEAEQNKSGLSETIQNYWNTEISTLTRPLTLYGRKNSASTSMSKRVSLKLGPVRTQKLRALAQKPEISSWTQDLTLFNLFTTTLFTFLYRLSGQKKIAIGAPSHNRATKNFKQTPGLFIEVFPLTTELEDNDTFLTVLDRIKLVTNNYLRYAQPGMSTSEISRSFSVVLNYINASFPDFDGMPMQSEWIHPEHCDPGHQLRCHVHDMDASGDIEVHFDLNIDVFHQSLINEVPKHFMNIFDAMINDIHQPINKPSLVKNIDVNKIITKTYTDEFKSFSIIEQFEQQSINSPNEIALKYDDRIITFEQLNLKANQLANYLENKGISSNKRIALFLERSPEYIMSILAIMKVGATFIPISSDQPSQRINYILQDADISLVFTTKKLDKKIIDSSFETTYLDLINLSDHKSEFSKNITADSNIAYIIYTSGSTGKPKGVLISQGALSNYLNWSKTYYAKKDKFIFPLFTSPGFDLTITSTLLPLISGGELIIYREANQGPDISIIRVFEENKVNSIKLTPSHLALVQNSDWSHSKIKTMIVGGEDFKTKLAENIQKSFSNELSIYNEYGPTEATVGCIVNKYNEHQAPDKASVPIGFPIDNMQTYVLDSYKNIVPDGVMGELYISGKSLAKGYVNLDKLTNEKFLDNPHRDGAKMYHTGDLARVNSNGELECLGRIDEQVKISGFRIELTDIESNLLEHESIENTAVVIIENEKAIPENEVVNCSECGLPSNYPNTDFNEMGVCHICTAFKDYEDKANRYFKTEDELKDILLSKRGKHPNYDCISLLSGGKDSTYILAQLVNMGLKVLAFTLDNGYISDQAKDNINRIVTKLGVDHIYGHTQHMNKIFVDSLQRHQNVCNGCFKTIYTLSTQLALEKQIPFIVTGLSRGQFFETRLTEELFWDEDVDVNTIDETILEARKLYHQEDDAIKNLLDVSMFNSEATFEKVHFLDFYRYSDVSLEEMLKFLKEKVDWVRPTDTGRSTNCLINQLGIYVHKKEKGYSNYSFPYSWDVRMGHKTRTETLEEINEVINEGEVKRIMQEIGYHEPPDNLNEKRRLVGYYTGKQKLSSKSLVDHLKKELPEYMIPSLFKYVDKLPLTNNGKVDKQTLKSLNTSQLDMDTPYVAPEAEIEMLLANIWKEVLNLKQVGIHDNFIGLGGHSLAAIRVTARINDEIKVKFPLNKVFELPTVMEYSKFIEETLTALLEE